MGKPDTGPPGVNIVDVARLAGVSISTVSRTLRGSVNVSGLTRDRVLQAAAELAYVPSPAASRLASGRTRTIGVIVQFSARWFFAEVVRGAEGVLRSSDYDLLLFNVGDPCSRAHLFETMPLRRRVDAVLAVATEFTQAESDALGQLAVPLVVVGNQAGPTRYGVGVDDVDSAAMAVRHLVLLGHRDIAMISGLPDDPIGQSTTLARRTGFAAGLRAAGLPSPPDLIVAEPWGVEGGRRAMERLLTRRELPTAVFAESDEMAFGALNTLRRVGLNVPGYVSVIGFDDHELAPGSDLTTIAQPAYEQGKLAAAMALDLLAHGASDEAQRLTLPTRLVVRGTTAPPRTEA